MEDRKIPVKSSDCDKAKECGLVKEAVVNAAEEVRVRFIVFELVILISIILAAALAWEGPCG